MGSLAADMGAGHRQVFADEMHQQRARFDEAFDLGAVHLHGDVSLCHRCLSPRSMIRKVEAGFRTRSCSVNNGLRSDHLIRSQRARPAARCSARITMMPPTCLRYSTGPRASAAGDMIDSAAAAAFFSVAASRLVPITALAASVASSGVSCRLVRPIAQAATLPPAMVSTTAAAAVA